MLLDDVSTILSDGGIGTAGSTEDWGLFTGFMPPLPDRVVGLFETGGTGSIRAMSSGPGLTPAEQPRVQVMVRGSAFDYKQARVKANDIFKLLDQMNEKIVNSTRYLWAAAIQSPIGLGLDNNHRPEISLNFEFVKELSTDTG